MPFLASGSRSLKPGHPVPDANGERAARRILAMVSGLSARRSGRRADFRGRLRAARCARRGAHLGGRTSGQPRAPRLRRFDRRDELRAQTFERDQRRPPGGRGLSSAGGDAADLRRARRRSRHDRLRPHGRRSHDDRRRSRDPVEIRDRRRAGGAQRFVRSASRETPKPGDASLARATTTLIATPRQSLLAAAAVARAAGVTPLS